MQRKPECWGHFDEGEPVSTNRKKFGLFVAVLMVIFFFVYMFEEQVLRFLDYKAVKLAMLISLITIIVGDIIYRSA
ncbi:hypothetical protein IC803_02195 [Geobacillus sp. 46C-IIa]|uniref:hypothetical protein n=1 Tax=Geobacillus sp. 46C-IIa TaxID=1963025 RepID=UPI00117B423F|nr:hypothetical protein [Geobacillus sp. 46C-IIa]QNU29784.1 hypothetical protein IC803_02195 [Geobacillus sp. 46C-IIa]